MLDNVSPKNEANNRHMKEAILSLVLILSDSHASGLSCTISSRLLRHDFSQLMGLILFSKHACATIQRGLMSNL